MEDLGIKNYWKIWEWRIIERSSNEEVLEDLGMKNYWKMHEWRIIGSSSNEELLEEVGMKNFGDLGMKQFQSGW